MSTTLADAGVAMARCRRCGSDLEVRVANPVRHRTPINTIHRRGSSDGRVYCSNGGCLHHRQPHLMASGTCTQGAPVKFAGEAA